MSLTQFGLTSMRGCWNSSFPLAAILVLTAIGETARSQEVIIDGEGFESPSYSTTFDGDGKLEGQEAQLPNNPPFPGFEEWRSSSGTSSTASVQGDVVLSGNQAVQVDRSPNDLPGGGRWAVPVEDWPTLDFVNIEWDMRVEDAAGPSGSFGPFFGIEAYDAEEEGDAETGRLGLFGVDANTGEILYSQAGTGFLQAPGEVVNFGEWYNYRMKLDYQAKEYTIFLNGSPLWTEPFEGGTSLSDFTDADITAIAASADPVSQGLSGTAYFDNYLVYQIPEPSTALLLALAMLGVSWNQRRSG